METGLGKGEMNEREEPVAGDECHLTPEPVWVTGF